MSDLTICGSDFQRRVLSIRHQLDLYNQIAPNAQSLFDKTFDTLSAENHKIVIANLEEAYRDAGNRAETIIEKIYDLKERYGDRRD